MSAPLSTSSLSFPLVRRGKVRDVYDVGEDRLLIVATDRISAFDVVMPQAIPLKGFVLTQITAWWLSRLGAALPHHMISADAEVIAQQVPALRESIAIWRGRSMLVKRTEPLTIECVVRGYIAGSAWKEYTQGGTLAGEALPPGLQESSRLKAALFSPATKAEEGHDENIRYDEAEQLVGAQAAAEARDRSLQLYVEALAVAERSGIIIADTKFEFGTDGQGALLLIDEVLTPDSSRFWPQAQYVPGRAQPSFDKQPVRDYLEALTGAGRWNKQAPGPDLPAQVVRATTDRYRAVYERLTGTTLDVPETA